MVLVPQRKLQPLGAFRVFHALVLAFAIFMTCFVVVFRSQLRRLSTHDGNLELHEEVLITKKR